MSAFDTFRRAFSRACAPAQAHGAGTRRRAAAARPPAVRLGLGFALALALLPAAVLPAQAREGRPLTVEVANRSVQTLCAEDDNIYLTFSSPRVRHFKIEARHPAVIGTIVVDSTAPDFTNCTIEDKPPNPAAKDERIVIFEDDRLMLVGHRNDPAFWRKDEVPVRVGDREEHNVFLLQLFLKRPGKEPYEHLVLYPMDGYWRARPLPPARLEQVAYGTSFLVGMVEERKRPFVALKSVRFDPRASIFHLTFPKNDVATLRVASITETSSVLEVMFEKPVTRRPFAALRSMYVTDVNADASLVAHRAPWRKGWEQRPIMEFRGNTVNEFWLGRAIPSRHNTSAPDTLLYDFMPD